MSFHMKTQNYSEAILEYNSKLLETPNNPKLLINRALAFFHQKKYIDSIQDCKQILKRETYHVKAYWRLGRCYECTQQWELAWKCYLHISNIKEVKEKMLNLRPLIMGPHFTTLEQKMQLSDPSFCITNLNNDRGLIACKPIRKNDIVLNIGLDSLITESFGRATPWGKLFAPYEKDINDEFLVYLVFSLTSRILQMPDDPYMLSMPNDTSHMPFFWSDQQLAIFGTSYIAEQIKMRKQNAMDIYNILQEKIPDFTIATSQDKFLYLMSLVSTRNFTVSINGKIERLMVPFADMMNHHGNPNTKWFFNDQKKSFQIQATQDIELGDMLFDSYGDRDNGLLMSVYGFSLPMNFYDKVRIIPFVFLHRNGALSSESFDKLRTHFKGTPQNIEKSILKYIRGRIETLQYPTTLEEDETWLSSNTDYTPEYFIRLALVSEKHILKEWSNIINECLGTPTKRQKRKWKSSKNERLYLKLIWSKFK